MVASLKSLVIFLVLVHCTNPAQVDYDNFVIRWSLENQHLPCIHQKVENLGTSPEAQIDEPNWQGQRTYCLFLQQPVSVVKVYKWPSYDEGFLALAFVKSKAHGVSYAREGEQLAECETFSDLDTPGPDWLRTSEGVKLDADLRPHCFYKNAELAGPEPVKVVFKVTRQPEGELQGTTVRFVLPRKPNYLTYEREEGLNDICTRCNAAGGPSKKILVKSSNITALLEELKEQASI